MNKILQALHRALACLCVVAVLLSGSCTAMDELLDENDKSSEAEGQQNQGGYDCYPSFPSFKRAMERAGKKPPDDQQWHHIVEQNPGNKKRFSDRLHCTYNLIAISRAIHQKISGHYSSKPDWTEGKTVRQVISARSWQEQYDYGVTILRRNGIRP